MTEQAQIEIDSMTIDDLRHTEEEVLNVVRSRKLETKEMSRALILIRRQFAKWRDVLYLRDLVKRETIRGKL